MLCGAGPCPAARANAAAGQPVPGVIGIQLLDAPVDQRLDPRALIYIVDHLLPGAAIQRQVRVVNKSPQPQHIEIYPAAATISAQTFRFGAGHTPNELTSWISIDHPQVDLQPYRDTRVAVTIRVPRTASTGERYAMIWASVTSSPNPATGITQINRVGIRVYLDIGPGGEPPSDFAIGQLIPGRDPNGNPSLSIQVRNTGERALDMTGSVTLSEGPAGSRAGPFEVVHGTTLAPSEAGTVAVTFPDDLPNGPWKIEVTLTSGLVTHTGTGRITFPNTGSAGQPSSLHSPHHPTNWILVGELAAAALAVLGGLILLIRRSRRQPLSSRSDGRRGSGVS